MDASLEIVDEVVIAGGSQKRHRSRAGVQLIAGDELFVAFRIGWDMFNISHGGVVGTWSSDGGRTWEEVLPLVAEPGWDWFGAQRLLRLSDGSLLMLAGKARWNTDLFLTYSIRSRDGGRTWEEAGREIKMFDAFSEPYGQGVIEGLAGGRLMMGFQGTDTKDESAKVGVAFSTDDGTSWSDRSVIASEPGIDFREADTLRLNDGRILAVIRTDRAPYDTYQSYSDDEGRSWTPIQKTGFHGHCVRLFQLRNAIACFFRDMDPARPGISYSLTCDDAITWSFGGRLYESPSGYEGWASACGYPAVVSLPGEDIFCVYHTDFVESSSEIRGVFLSDKT